MSVTKKELDEVKVKYNNLVMELAGYLNALLKEDEHSRRVRALVEAMYECQLSSFRTIEGFIKLGEVS